MYKVLTPYTRVFYSPMATEMGVCYSFNALSMQELFKPSDFTAGVEVRILDAYN